MNSIYRFLLLAITFSYALGVQAQLPTAFTDRLNFMLDSVASKYHLKGVSASIMVPGVGTWNGVYGESEAGKPITPDMYFGMGSNTKTHIAALLLKMQEQQLLDLDDSIGKWIQGYPNINGKITIRQCLNHTSGLYSYTENIGFNDSIFGNPSKEWTKDDILKMVLAPEFNPGASWSYSNTNYVVAGMIIEAVLQKPAYVALKEMILEPNGLTHTWDYGAIPGGSMMANPWTMNLGGNHLTDLTTTPYTKQLFTMANTAGSLLTTAEENANFWHKLTSGQLLSPASWEEMTRMILIGGNQQYGLGIFRLNKLVNGRTAYSHGGTFFGFIAENLVDTSSKICFSILSNQDSIGNGELQAYFLIPFHKLTLDMHTGLKEATGNKPAIGIYPNPAAGAFRISVDGTISGGTVKVFSTTGQLMATQTPDEAINCATWPDGIYLAEVFGAGGDLVGTQKIMVYSGVNR